MDLEKLIKSSLKKKATISSCSEVVVAFVFYFLDPADYLFFPKCPFLMITGFECPGCGSQRAIHDLLHFRISDAFNQNAIVPIALPYIFLGIYLDLFGGKEKFPRLERFFFGKWAGIIVIIIFISYWILRNIFL